ncbi:hypothetical protein HAX54_037412 [Datura stramonium]|uniref:Uncharacterized protein n=1 Tax=Datura stramonium TaxID=4076 RepID=A0ABS8SHA4_DATST|nr:hypothetical protein [Datura stramonium]
MAFRSAVAEGRHGASVYGARNDRTGRRVPGLHTVMQQLRRAPNVHVKKSRRETLPEIVEPEHVGGRRRKVCQQIFIPKGGSHSGFR